jgi:HK97 family phage portal protein
MGWLQSLFGQVPRGGGASSAPEGGHAPQSGGAASMKALAQAAAGDVYPFAVTGTVASAADALTLSAVHRSVSLITGAIGAMPLMVRRKIGGQREDAENHWAHALLTRKPNSWQTPQQFKRLIAAHLLLRGNAFCMKIGSGRQVSQLIPLNPDRIRVEQMADWSVVYHYTTTNSGVVTLSQKDILHFVGLSLNGVTGVSVLSAAAETFRYGKSLQAFGRSTMENGARFGGALKHPRTLDEAAQARLVESIERFRGSANAGKLLVLEEGMDFTPLSMTLEDAQFIEAAASSRLEVYQFFGIPPFLAGDTEKSTSWGSGIESMNQAFVDYTLNDWLVTIEDTLNTHLIPPPIYCRFNRNSLVRGDISARFNAYSIARKHEFMSVDEIRALEDFGPMSSPSPQETADAAQDDSASA